MNVCFASKALYGSIKDISANARAAKWWDQTQTSFHASAGAMTFFLLTTNQILKPSVLIAFESIRFC